MVKHGALQALQGLYKEHSRGAETMLGRSAKGCLEDWGQVPPARPAPPRLLYWPLLIPSPHSSAHASPSVHSSTARTICATR